MLKSISIVLTTCMILVGCGNSSSNHSVKGELLLELSSKEIKDTLRSAGWTDFGDSKIYGYKAYKISYVTKDENDKEVNASGLFVIPTEVDEKIKEDGFSLVSYGHGTLSLNDNAPSVYTEKEKDPIVSAIIFSSFGGFATLQADYIGYGDSQKQIHTYIMKKSLANASIDFINAVKKFAKRENIKLNKKLFITGYSEGGYTAMATLQELEKRGTPVTATAPLAGDFNLNDAADIIFGLKDKNIIASTYSRTYLSLATLAYTKIYNKNIESIIKKPYAKKMDKLFDGKHSFEQIEKSLPTYISGEEGLVRDDFIDDYYQNENNWFKKALKKNNVDNWKANTPIHIFHCEGDDQSSYETAQKTYNQMIENGSKQIELITLDSEQAENEKWNHDECELPALLSSFLWFKEIRDE